MSKDSKCLVVTVLPCDHPNPLLESPLGCCECGMLEWWTTFDSEEAANAAFMKQYPDQFKDGHYIGNGGVSKNKQKE